VLSVCLSTQSHRLLYQPVGFCKQKHNFDLMLPSSPFYFSGTSSDAALHHPRCVQSPHVDTYFHSLPSWPTCCMLGALISGVCVCVCACAHVFLRLVLGACSCKGSSSHYCMAPWRFFEQGKLCCTFNRSMCFVLTSLGLCICVPPLVYKLFMACKCQLKLKLNPQLC